jgi:dipeptidyl aminopeptidase/acylaminoacyl peptidase
MRSALALIIVLTFVTVPFASGQLPPLLDRELFFGDPEISGAQISGDGKHISFIKPFKGVRNIWVKRTEEPFSAARPLTADTTRPITGYFWSRDSRNILYGQDKGGDENYRIYSVDPSATGDPVPASRDLTPIANVRAMIYDVPKGTPNEIIIGLNDRRSDLHDVYRLNIVTGQKTLIRKNDDNVMSWITDLKGNLRLALRQTADGGTEILRVDDAALTSIYAVGPEESATPVRFTPDGNKFYLVTNKGKMDKSQLELFDLATGTTSYVERDPLNEVDFGGAMFSELTDELLATTYVGDRVRLYPRQKKFGDDYARMKKRLPDGELGIMSETDDETVMLVAVSNDVDPATVYVYNRITGEARLLYRSRPQLPSNHLAQMKSVRYPARDGFSIPAYLVVPKGVPATNLPAVLLIHGGPWSRVTWGFNSEAQFLANRGYAVLIPNFRGSTGYGKKFLNAGNKQWGTGGMQHDISDGVQYLLREKIADPKRVGIYGGSYGGYATLAGLAFTPDLYAAGISYVGPSNIITLLKSIPPYWAPIKKLFAVRVGDMDKPNELKMLEEQSPLNSAKNMKAPLLVIQGANDPRVKKAESDQMVVALRDLGRSVEYLVAPDEGHGFAGKMNRLAGYTAMERFFAKHLGGRYQETVRPEIQQKLDALTVSVATVKMPDRQTTAVAAPAATFQAARVKEESVKYTTTFQARGTSITMNTTRTVRPASVNNTKVWRVIDTSSGPMGGAADTVDLDAGTLLTVQRNATQGPARVLLSFGPTGVSGKIKTAMGEMPLDLKGSSPLVSDGAGFEVPLATLPLAEGYTARVNVFDMMSQKIRDMHISVSGKEKAATAGGEFESFVVDARPADGEGGAMKFWIATPSGTIVKSEMELPAAMGGGKAVTELAK